MSKPNILVLLFDQLNAGILQTAHGNAHVATPNLDALYAESVAFEKAVITNPECVPGRISIWTGHYPRRYGIRNNSDAAQAPYKADLLESVAPRLQRAGYHTWYGGKSHFADGNEGVTAVNYRFSSYSQLDGAAQGSAAVASRIAQSRAEPWFYCFSCIQPHDITYLAQGEGDDSGYPTEVQDAIAAAEGQTLPPLPANYALSSPEPDGVGIVLANRPANAWARANFTDADWRLYLWVYYRLVELCDAAVGTIMTALEASPYADNTIVIVASEHGDMLGAHHLANKSLPYRECGRVPMYWRVPGATPSVDTEHIVNWGIDFLPTLADYCGFDASGLPGRSLKPLIDGESPSWRDHAIIESRAGLAAYDGRHVYWRDDTYPGGTVPESLFDHDTDPGELTNVISEPSYAAVKATLSAAVDAHTP